MFCCAHQRFDEDDSGTISRTEFQLGLKAAREELEAKQGCAFPALAISDIELDCLFKVFDRDGSGDISFDEFLSALQEGSGPHMDAMKKLRSSMSVRLRACRPAGLPPYLPTRSLSCVPMCLLPLRTCGLFPLVYG